MLQTGGGMCVEGEVRGVTGSVRIHHLTGVSPEGRSRFPKLEDCAHFHYEHVELGPIQVTVVTDRCGASYLPPYSHLHTRPPWPCLASPLSPNIHQACLPLTLPHPM